MNEELGIENEWQKKKNLSIIILIPSMEEDSQEKKKNSIFVEHLITASFTVDVLDKIGLSRVVMMMMMMMMTTWINSFSVAVIAIANEKKQICIGVQPVFINFFFFFINRLLEIIWI